MVDNVEKEEVYEQLTLDLWGNDTEQQDDSSLDESSVEVVAN